MEAGRVYTGAADGKTWSDQVMRRVALIGAGFIARVHAEALQTISGVRVAAVVDPNRGAAESLAGTYGGAAIHVDRRRARRRRIRLRPRPGAATIARDVALPLVRAGKPVLLEKPMAASSADCARAARRCRALRRTARCEPELPVPSGFRAAARPGGGAIAGTPNFVGCIYNVPLRQLAARQFGHWMFATPVNLLLEQAVHPLSQIAAIAGTIA